MTGEPILIPCEGAGCPPTRIGTCTMCGRPWATDPTTGLVCDHDRDDIMARLHRGDFG